MIFLYDVIKSVCTSNIEVNPLGLWGVEYGDIENNKTSRDIESAGTFAHGSHACVTVHKH